MRGEGAYVSMQRLGSPDCASETKRQGESIAGPSEATPPPKVSNSQPPCHMAVLVCQATGFSYFGVYTPDHQILLSVKKMLL